MYRCSGNLIIRTITRLTINRHKNPLVLAIRVQYMCTDKTNSAYNTVRIRTVILA